MIDHRQFFRAGVRRVTPEVEARIREEVEKATGLAPDAYRITPDTPPGTGQVRVTVRLGRGRVT